MLNVSYVYFFKFGNIKKRKFEYSNSSLFNYVFNQILIVAFKDISILRIVNYARLILNCIFEEIIILNRIIYYVLLLLNVIFDKWNPIIFLKSQTNRLMYDFTTIKRAFIGEFYLFRQT